MLLIKIGGSIISPKNKPGYIDTQYLNKFATTIKKHNAVVVHGTGNVGHGFIQQYGLSSETYSIGRKALDQYFGKIDEILLGYNRIQYIKHTNRATIQPKTIIGGDITTDYNIISSDLIFAEILAQTNIQRAIVATDVDGVLDEKKKIIPTITKNNIDTIHFRSKQGDVTGGMEAKIQQLIKHNQGSNKIVRICNGYNLENIEQIITTNQGIGTQILL